MSTISSREEALFADALARPAAERAAFLSEACGGDAARRARLIALLNAWISDNLRAFNQRKSAGNSIRLFVLN